MKFFLFSVVIPAYNAANFIKGALDSVRLQKFSNYEIVVVDDGSSDNTLEVVRRYFIDYPLLKHLIVNQNNKGIGVARNTGIKTANGEFVAFLDADDRWHKDKLLKIKQYCKLHPDVDLVCHDEHLVKNGRILKRIKHGPYTSYKELLFKGNCLSTSAVVVRRNKLFEAGLFSENLDFNGVEDYELWLRLSKICKIGYLHEVLGVYNIHGAGITNNIEEHLQHSFNVTDSHYLNWPNKNPTYRKLIDKRKSELMRATAFILLQDNRIIPARNFLKKAAALNPLSIKIWITVAIVFIKSFLKK